MSDTAKPDPPSVLITGSGLVVLARKWQIGEFTGLTADAVYLRVDGYDTLQEAQEHMEWHDTGSEDLAKGLAAGELKMAAINGPVLDV